MRIGLFTDTYTPDINGVVTSIVTLKKALEEKGHTVFVITNHASITQTSYENDVLRLPGIEVKFLYGYVLSSPLHIQATSVIKEMELDLVHAHSEFGIGVFARSIAKNFNLPLVMTYHTTYEDYTHYVNLWGLKSIDQLSKKAVAGISRVYAKNAQVIIAPSDKTKKMLLGYKIKKQIEVIPTGLDLKRFECHDEGRVKAIKDQYDLHDKVVFTYIGRLAKEKSVDFVLESFARLLKRKDGIKLIIVGGGPSDEDLKELASSLGINDDVVFTGSVSSDDVINFYHLTDAFFSASLTETQGLTYIEALACGLCVFARPDKPLDGIIVDDETGYLFDTFEGFVDKACIYLDSPQTNKDRIKDNAIKMTRAFDLSLYGDRIVSAYQDAINTYHGMFEVISIEAADDHYFVILKAQETQEALLIDEHLLNKSNIKVGDIMGRHEINELDESQEIYEAYQKAVARISRRDYTSFEMTQYFRDKFTLPEDKVEYLVEKLISRHFINDERYFIDKIDYHRSQGRGNHWIAQDLSKRGFGNEKIYAYLEDENQGDYVERAATKIERFLASLKEGSLRQRELKVRQHLTRQGFDYEIINAAISNKLDNYSDEQETKSLKKLIVKSSQKYSEKYDEYETKNRIIKNALSKGYTYDMITKVLEDVENEN